MTARRAVLAIGAAAFALHIAFAARYGWFRDELYYVSCARRLAWGYVDHPPVVAVIARVSLAVFGDSLVGLRSFAALAAAGTAMLAGEIARAIGGGRFAQVLAAFAAAVAPYDLAVGQMYTMNAFEPLVWSGLALVVVRAIGDPASAGANALSPRALYWLGPIAGIGILNKHSAAWPVAALALGVVASPARRLLLRKEAWIAALVAAVLVAPHIAWQAANGFPTREFAKNALSGKNEAYGVFAFVWHQMELMHPLSAPLWIGGLAALFALPRLRAYRPLGAAYVVVAALIVATQAKAYYLAPIYGSLFAAGAVAFEHVTRERARWTRVVYPALLGLGVAVLLPMTVPVLHEADFQRYFAALGGFGEAKSGEKNKPSALPQLYADMHGWPEMAAAVEQVVDAIPEQERRASAVLTDNYGEASAVEFFAGPHGLTRVASGNNGWWLWGPPRPPPGAPSVLGWPSAVVTIGYDADELEPFFADIREAARFDHPLARANERDLPIFVCRAPRISVDEAWPKLKHYR